LTWQKLTGGSILQCGTAECGSVLTGPYSSIFGVPVSAMGLASYALLLALSAAPFVLQQDTERFTRLPLLILSTFMAAFSVYLVLLLVFKLHTTCAFCFLSAALSWSSFFIVQRAASIDSQGLVRPIIVPTISSVAAAFLAGAVSLYVTELNIALDEARTIAIAIAEQGGPVAAAQNAPNGRFFPPESKEAAALATSSKTIVTFSPPAVDTTSTERTIRLAKHLQTRGAKVYGAYWCSHCYNQKQIFGAQAAKLLNYIECAPDGENSQRGMCQDRRINGYPTWEIDGKFYAGEKSIDELEALSGLTPQSVTKEVDVSRESSSISP